MELHSFQDMGVILHMTLINFCSRYAIHLHYIALFCERLIIFKDNFFLEVHFCYAIGSVKRDLLWLHLLTRFVLINYEHADKHLLRSPLLWYAEGDSSMPVQ